jgi:DNA-directed RNA polymerase specialized sigma24 family protein
MRTAYLLTEDTHLAKDLLQTVLTRVASHRPKLARHGNSEAYARKAPVNQYLSWRRPHAEALRGERPHRQGQGAKEDRLSGSRRPTGNAQVDRTGTIAGAAVVPVPVEARD